MNAPQRALSPEETKHTLLQVLRAIRTRHDAYSFRLVQAQLRDAHMPTAQGWEPLLAKYSSIPVEEKALATWLESARQIFWNAIIVSRRAVVVFDVSDDQLEIFDERAASSLIDHTVPFAAPFPYPVDEDLLRASSYNGKFVATTVSENGDTWYFACAKRSFRNRVAITVEELGEDLGTAARDMLQGYDEVIGIKSGVLQAYDAVVIRRERRQVEIHIDLCCPFSDADIGQARTYYTNILNNVVIASDDTSLRLLLSHNFFPDIQRLYNTEGGMVSSLGHATGTKSIKEERMRSRLLDLRDELFHKEGMREIGETDAFSIRKGWLAVHKHAVPTVIIPGHFAMVDQPGGRVDYAIVENCLDFTDFQQVMNHLGVTRQAQ